MSNSLGTLMFGADIDLTQLKQKIQSGNQDILNALKMNYDPKSYTDMVSKLKSELSKETFEIKIKADAKNLFSKGVGNNSPVNFSEITQKILDQQKAVNELTAKIVHLRQEYARLGNGFNEQLRANEIKTKLLPNTIDQLADAKKVLGNLEATKKAYTDTVRSTGRAHSQASESVNKLNSDHLRLNTTLSNGIHISSRLDSALSSLFAINEARRFLSNVIEIGGQLEKQRISMGAIVGDTARANELFDQIKSMAIKSPFGVVELDQYSKQLAAYGVEQSKLFDMTKRLADISAGAGQDIGRLALALGHVKSATYLTGITLRQFSMNNIPMLKMLADYYSEVEKRAVSTAEVQKRISERKVSYEDVVEQIKRMTDEGGMFYNMQEKISESLAAKWKNLRDSIDIMYGDLAESKIGDILKRTAEVLMGLTTNWRSLSVVLAVAAATFGAMRVAVLSVNRGMAIMNANAIKGVVETKELTVAQRWLNMEIQKGALNFTLFGTRITAFTKLFGKLRLALYGIGAAAKTMAASLIAAIPQMAVFAGISALIGLWQRNNEEMEKAADLGSHLFDRTQEGLKNLKNMMEETGMVFRDQYGNISNLFGKVPGSLQIPDVKTVDSAQMAKNIETWQEFIKNYSATPNLMLQAAYAIDENGKATRSLAEQYQSLGESAKVVAESLPLIAKFGEYLSEAIQESDSGWFDDDLLTDLKDYENTVKSYKRYAQDLFREHKKEAIAAADAAMANSDFSKAINDAGIKSDDYASQLYKLSIESEKFGEAVKSAAASWKESVGTSLFSEDLFKKGAFGSAEDELEKEFDQVVSRLKAKLESGGVDLSKISEPERLALTQVFTDMATKAGLSVDEVTKKVWELVQTAFPSIKIDINDVEIAAKTSAIKEELDNLVDGEFSIDIKSSTNAFDVIKAIREGYKAAKDLIQNAEPILMKMGLTVEGVSEMTDEQIEKAANGSEIVKQILEGVKNAQKKINDAIKASNTTGFSLTDPTKGGKVFRDKKNSTDETLKKWKEQLKELENFYKVYKRNAEYMSKDDAIKKALDSGVFLNLKDLPENIDDYLKVLHDFRNKVEKEMGTNPSTERKSFLTDLLTKIDEKEFEINTKDVADKFLKALQDNISKQSEKFNLYKSILENTGDQNLAERALVNGHIFDNLAREYEKQLKDMTGEIDIDYDMSNVEAEEHYKNIKGAYDLWKEIVKITSDNYNESLKLASDEIAKHLSYEDKILAIRKRYNEIIDNAPNDIAKKAYQRAMEEEIASVKYDELKDQINWDAVFGNVDYYTKEALKRVKRQLSEFRKSKDYKNFGVDKLKAFEEGYDRISKALNQKEGLFGAIKQAVEDYEDATDRLVKAGWELAQAEAEYGKNSVEYQTALTKYNQAKQNRDNAGTGVDDAKNETYNKVASISNAIASLGKKDGASLAEVGSVIGTLITALSSTNTTIGNLIAAIMAILDAIGNDPKGFVGNLGNSIGNAVYGINSMMNLWRNIEGSWMKWTGDNSWITEKHYESQSLEWMRGPNYLEYEKAKAEYESLINVWDDLIDRKRTYLNERWGTESAKAGKEALNLLQSELEATKEIAKIRLDSGSSFNSHSIRYRMWQGSYDYNGTNWKDVAPEISRKLGIPFNDMDDLLNMTSEQLLWIKQNYSGLWAHMDDEFKEHLENIIEYGEDVQDIIDQIDEKLHGLTFDELIDSYYDFVIAGKDANDVLSKDLETKLKEAIVKGMIENLYAERINKIIDKATELGKNEKYIDKNGNIRIHSSNPENDEVASEYTAEEYALIKQMSEDLGNDVKATEEMLKAMYGWTDDNSSSSSTGSSIKGITENTADLLASYLNSIRADVSVDRNMIATYYPQFLTVITQVSVLSQTQVTLQQQIAANTLRNAEAADKIYDILHRVTPDGTSIRVK